MKNNRPHLAMEILRREVRRTRAWKTAFIVAFVVVIIDRIFGKAGTDHEENL